MSLLLLGKALLEKCTTPPLSLSLTHHVNVDINENNFKPKMCNTQHHPNITWARNRSCKLPLLPLESQRMDLSCYFGNYGWTKIDWALLPLISTHKKVKTSAANTNGPPSNKKPVWIIQQKIQETILRTTQTQWVSPFTTWSGARIAMSHSLINSFCPQYLHTPLLTSPYCPFGSNAC